MSKKDALSQNNLIKGRGAQLQVQNKFLQYHYVKEHPEGLDEEWELSEKTQYFIEHPKKLVNKVESPDIGLNYSMNPYQGCEHGCIYCYARNTHEYYGFSAGLDFENKIIVKPSAPEVLKKQFEKKNWEVMPIMLSGNTDCYQPIERKLGITRKILEICLEYKHPVSLITKNELILRDMYVLKELSKLNLVSVSISITTLNESIRQKLEPRTSSSVKRIKAIEELSKQEIPVSVMTAPIIPFINSHEIPNILKTTSEAGAIDAGYILVRLNGVIGQIFENWIFKSFPDKADRVLANIKKTHGGKLNESRYGTRMKGEGEFAESIATIFKTAKRKYMNEKSTPKLRTDLFSIPQKGQLDLFNY